jgi:hypothetical protein
VERLAAKQLAEIWSNIWRFIKLGFVHCKKFYMTLQKLEFKKSFSYFFPNFECFCNINYENYLVYNGLCSQANRVFPQTQTTPVEPIQSAVHISTGHWHKGTQPYPMSARSS